MRSDPDRLTPRPLRTATRSLVPFACAVLLGGGSAEAQLEPTFSRQAIVPDGGLRASALEFSDLDRDGDLDLVILRGTFGDLVTWWENVDGAGTTWIERTIADPRDSIERMQIGDIDGDGDDDVAATIDGVHELRWWKNPGNVDDAWEAQTVTSGLPSIFAVALGDVDRDGDLDAIAASGVIGDFAWFENLNGVGGSWARHTVDDDRAIGSIEVADVDRDGDLDLVTTSLFETAWWSNLNGDGSAWQRNQVDDEVLEYGYRAWIGDVNGDSSIDIVATGVSPPGTILVAINSGDGTQWEKITLSGLSHPHIDFRDLDLDGDLDIAEAGTSDTVRWWENLGDGRSWASHVVDSSYDNPDEIVIADLNGDGLPDLATTSTLDDRVAWWPNGAIHRRARFEIIEPNPPLGEAQELAPADLDRDGDLDVVVTLDNTIRWWRNDFPDHFGFVVASDVLGVRSVDAADLDGDGDLDILSASVDDDKVRWFESNGAAPPELAFFSREISTEALGATSVRAGDLDGDGDLDVAVASRADDTVRWFENSGAADPTFLPAIVTTTADSVRSIEIADLNGDGRLDLVSASREDDNVRWYENSGDSPPLFIERIVSTTADGARSVRAGDLDGDGDTDLAVAAELAGTVYWYANDGNSPPAFVERVAGTFLFGTTSVDISDIDTDGDLDLVVPARDTRALFVLKSDGAPIPSYTSEVLDDDLGLVQFARVVDYSGDGNPDVLASSFNQFEYARFINCGGQYSVTATSSAPATLVQGTADDLLTLDVIHHGRTDDVALAIESLSLRFGSDSGAPLTTDEANALVEQLSLYRDTGSGVFEAAADLVIETLLFLEVDDGLVTLDLSALNPDLEVAPEATARFFVVPTLTADAAAQPVNRFQITHLAADGGPQPVARPTGSTAALTLDCPADFTTVPVTAAAYTLEAVGTCPGRVEITLTGADPGAAVGFLAGDLVGEFEKPQPPCQGLVLSLDNPTLANTVTADETGTLQVTPTLTDASCGQILQAADLATCRVSATAELP